MYNKVLGLVHIFESEPEWSHTYLHIETAVQKDFEKSIFIIKRHKVSWLS